MWWKKNSSVKKSETELKLQMIEDILFPQYTLEATPNGKFFHIDYAVDSNLEAVLCDLQEGKNDAVSQAIINSAIKKLLEARKLLGVKQYLDKRAEYIILDLPNNINIGNVDE